MKRKKDSEYSENIKREKSQLVQMNGVGGDHLAWDIIIRKLDYKSQLKISQQNQRLAEVVHLNAESEIRKFQRHIREDKYM